MNINLISKEIAVLTAGSEGTLFHVEKQVERDGIEMGVLENGVPYLSENGLARMCGISRGTLYALANNWSKEKSKARGQYIAKTLEASEYTEPTLFIKCEINGQPINAYTEPVCLALLEYYAFEAQEQKREAQNAFRTLARVTFRTYIYSAVGYSPETTLLDNWKHYLDRVDCLVDAVPVGYFSVFKEIAPIIIPLIKAGLIINDKVIPDLSAGKLWSKFWEENKYDALIGERVRYAHNYPSYYPQAKSNPQSAYAYPEAALGIFRAWLRQYVEGQFPKYLVKKAREGYLGKAEAAKAIEAMTAPQPLPRK